ncbi:MAG: energy-coupling factor transporter ATPase [Ruminococcaceae bacterium]|nr:energy-coupling factor transporter ATPase [Oscillospiraceae bacterium]
MSFIEGKDLFFLYENENNRSHIVLDNINFSVNQGEFVSVLGHNGSGKSTLAKHLNAILLPIGGSVIVDNMDTKNEELLFEIRQRIGMVFQNPDNQLVATIVEEDVAFGPENLGIPQKEIRQRVDDALKAVGMYEYRNHAPHLLSGGQKQRIAIAGILAMKPKCIILDEPTAMLDPAGREEVIKTIKKLNHEEGITVILITHYMNEAAQSDRVIVMNEGQILLDDTPHKVFMNVGLLKNIGLDVPQSTDLMFSLRKLDLKFPLEIITVEECVNAIEDYLSHNITE